MRTFFAFFGATSSQLLRALVHRLKQINILFLVTHSARSCHVLSPRSISRHTLSLTSRASLVHSRCLLRAPITDSPILPRVDLGQRNVSRVLGGNFHVTKRVRGNALPDQSRPSERRHQTVAVPWTHDLHATLEKTLGRLCVGSLRFLGVDAALRLGWDHRRQRNPNVQTELVAGQILRQNVRVRFGRVCVHRPNSHHGDRLLCHLLDIEAKWEVVTGAFAEYGCDRNGAAEKAARDFENGFGHHRCVCALLDDVYDWHDV